MLLRPRFIRALTNEFRASIAANDFARARSWVADLATPVIGLQETELSELRSSLDSTERRVRADGFLNAGLELEARESFSAASSSFRAALSRVELPEARAGLARIEGRRKLPGLALTLSVVPGLGQLYTGRGVASFLAFAGVGSLAASGVYLLHAADRGYAEYLAVTDPAAADTAYDRVMGRYAGAVTCLVVAGVFWIVNLIDAFKGVQEWNHETLDL